MTAERLEAIGATGAGLTIAGATGLRGDTEAAFATAGFGAWTRFAASLTVVLLAAGVTVADVRRVDAVREGVEVRPAVVAAAARVRVLVAAGFARRVVAAREPALAARVVVDAVFVAVPDVPFAAGLAMVVTRLTGLVLLVGLAWAAVLSSRAAPTALRRTEATPLRAAALEPYACDDATI